MGNMKFVSYFSEWGKRKNVKKVSHFEGIEERARKDGER